MVKLTRVIKLLVVIHYIIVALFVFDVIPQLSHHAGFPFWFHDGGDNNYYYGLAKNIASWDFSQANKFPLGFPLMIAPFIKFIGLGLSDLISPFAAFWTIVMFPIGQLLVFKIVKSLTKKDAVAFLTVFIWTVLPLVYFLGMQVFPDPNIGDEAVHFTWAQMATDGPTAFFSILTISGLLYISRHGYKLRNVIMLGGLVGYMMLVRYNSIIILIPVISVFLLDKKIKYLFALLFAAFIIFSPQLVYNWHFFGSPFTTGYTSIDVVPPGGLFNITYPIKAFLSAWKYIHALVIPIILFGVWVLISGYRYLAKLSRQGALVIGLWFLSYLVFYSFFYYSWIGCFSGYMIPAYPAMALLAAAAYENSPFTR